MKPNAIRKVLSLIRKRRLQCLLMGGQACVLYGAAEFSRDIDLALLTDEANLERLRRLLEDLRAERIAVPPFEEKWLRKGHAVHFRCGEPDTAGLRIDVMSQMRGVDPFPRLWERRTTLSLADGTECEIMSLPDLISAKKTQRDKDWPMIRRLVEVSYFAHRLRPAPAQIDFWLRELRTPELLLELAAAEPEAAESRQSERPAVAAAVEKRPEKIITALKEEEERERAADAAYWAPLRQELEELRRERRKRE